MPVSKVCHLSLRERSDAVASGRGSFVNAETTQHARQLRERQTRAESLLWSALRAKRLCGLKFRRQHPIGPFIADFACIERDLVVELDGGYHDHQHENDLSRQRYLQDHGWSVIRFANEDVLDDVEGVAISIAQHLGLNFNIRKRKPAISGMKVRKKPSPGPNGPTSPARGRGD